MKYRFQDEFDKIHRCVIVVIEHDAPHAWTFYLYLVLFEEIEFRFIEGFKWVWILFLRGRAAEYFCHTNPSIINNLKPLRWLLARPIPAPIRVPFPRDVASLRWVRPRPNHMCFRNEGISVASPASVTLPLGWRRSASLVHGGLKA